MNILVIRCPVLTLAALSFWVGSGSAQSPNDTRITPEQLCQLRSQMVKHRRRIIANNDGCDGLYQYVDEVCRNHDVDGIELDFFRHLCYFKSVADGGQATAAQGALMTELLRRIRRLTEISGCRRGRPILVAVRVPDSLHKPTVTLHLQMPLLHAARRVDVQWNGKALSDAKTVDGWLDFPVPVTWIKRGTNRVEISLAEAPVAKDSWNVVYQGNAVPKRPWNRDRGSERTAQKLSDGALMIADRGTVSGDYLYHRFDWGIEPEAETVVEACTKVISGSSYVILANGVGGERLRLAPNHIALYHHPKLRYDMDTTEAFHVYRVVLKGADLKVYVDNVLRIDAASKVTPRAGYPRSELAFGAANSTDVGAALWKYVKARTANASCQDMVVSVKYKK